MKYVLLAMFLFPHVIAFSQMDTTTYGYANGTLIKTEITPAYPGGPMAWKRFLERNSYYPLFTEQQNIAGKVTVAFTVNVVGKTFNYEVIKSVNPDLDKEALRLIRKSGLWFPAILNGKQVIYRDRIEIEFSLKSENEN